MAGHAEVKLPPGMSLKAIPEGTRHDHGRGEGEENEEAARSPLRQGPDSVGASRCLSTPFGDGGVAGALSAAGAARSFIRRGRG